MKSITRLLLSILCLVACINIAAAQDQDPAKTWDDILNEGNTNKDTPTPQKDDNRSIDFDQLGKDLEAGFEEIGNIFKDMGFQDGNVVIQGDTIEVMSEMQKAWKDLDVEELLNVSKEELEKNWDELKVMMDKVPEMLEKSGDQWKDVWNDKKPK